MARMTGSAMISMETGQMKLGGTGLPSREFDAFVLFEASPCGCLCESIEGWSSESGRGDSLQHGNVDGIKIGK